MSMALGEIAKLVDGQVHGDDRLCITGANILRDAQPGDITLADRAELQGELDCCTASAVVVSHDWQPQNWALIVVADVHQAFTAIVQRFRPLRQAKPAGVSPAAHVSRSAHIGVDSSVAPGVTIGDQVRIGASCTIYPGVHILAGAQIGDQVTLFPNVVLYENTVLGNRVTIHAGAVIGAYGFGYQTKSGAHERSAQLGHVVLGDDVEVGAGTTIDRGTYGSTRIGEGTKIDNQVMIAHNCRIGRHNLICSQVGIAGSCTTGDYVVMAGQVGMRDHIDIGEGVVLGAKAGIMHSLPDAGVYVGIPATAEREQMVKQAALAKLPEMRKAFKALQKQVAQLAEGRHRRAA